MRMLDNASITAKSLIATLIGAVVLAGMAAVAIVSLLEIQRTNTAAVAATTLRSNTRAAWTDLSRGHAALYRAINLKSQNVEVRIVRAAKDDFSQAINRAKTTLASIKIAGLPIDGQLAANTVKAFDQYAGSADQAASFVEEDAFNATMFMSDAEQKYDLAQQAAGALLKQSATLAQAMEDRMREVLRDALLVIPIAALLAVLLSVGATT